MSIKSNFPAISPSLLLDFSNTKKLDPRITFTRSSTATYFDNNGILQTSLSGIPRFDHNPITGESLGLLIEEQRTNLLTYSSAFDNGAWSKYNSPITNVDQAVAPDGTLTADQLVQGASGYQYFASPTVSASTAYTFSCYLKAGSQTNMILQTYEGVNGYRSATFNLSTGVVSATSGVIATITSVGNNWYRCAITMTTGAGVGGMSCYIQQATPIATGNTVFAWGAQLEAGAFATSYIPTVAAQVTRSADAASMTGTNFSSWFNASEGTLFAESSSINNIPRAAFLSLDGISSVVIGLGSSGTNFSRFYISNTTVQASIPLAYTGSVAKEAGAYKLNDAILAANSSLSAADTSCSIPVVNQLQIGYFPTAAASHNGTIKKITYYPRRLSNTELQAITG